MTSYVFEITRIFMAGWSVLVHAMKVIRSGGSAPFVINLSKPSAFFTYHKV